MDKVILIMVGYFPTIHDSVSDAVLYHRSIDSGVIALYTWAADKDAATGFCDCQFSLLPSYNPQIHK